VEFSAIAAGTGPFSYAWSKGGVILDGQTNDTLRIDSVELEDAGIYMVEVTGVCGIAQSSATLDVSSPTPAAPRIERIQAVGADFVIRFSTLAGRLYRVERADRITDPIWTPVADYVVGTGEIVEVTDRGGAGHTQRFYRVVLLSARLEPRIKGIQISGADVLIRFETLPGRFYRVERTDSLTEPVWSVVADYVPGTGEIVEVVDHGGAGRPSRFYRIILLDATAPPEPRISSIQISGNDVVIHFATIAGRFYRVERTDLLVPAEWSTVADYVVGTGAIVSVVDYGGAGRPSRFYRISLLADLGTMPEAQFTGSPTNGPGPLTVTFVDTSTGSISNRFWDFGDGTTTNTLAASVSHTYIESGLRTVTLEVSGPMGTNTLSRVDYIAVGEPVRISINAIRLSGADVLISFGTQGGTQYQLEYTDSLTEPVWLAAASPVPGTGGLVQVAHIGGVGPGARFYRMRALP
jgi:PKD repeat protein